ncbi:3alpha(or 20beta)-hydroxysteroid dehydrogenase [Prauserella sediminis]|uniref:3alpha(Or 20beta)-hydroxysteroid dehydrogenase n=1 Tax=Prauserella sediminis TaxID=577680 RepID=A0A839XYT2_9PSEU|nr:glucose 1-dehydrogenase [Prauserella sediminis]MBB3665573.1 3alpha(or 20beta)-hydroxysteroid dehydrogenase [Prauserella sediminis]
MNGRLTGRTALVTGAARGMGASIAARLVGEGAQVLLTDIDDAEGKRTARELEGEYQHLDVTSADDWAAAADTVRQDRGLLDILVNNAGIGSRPTRFDELDLEQHRRLFEVNVHGPFLGMRLLLPLLERSGCASVVNISSIDGLTGVAGMASYAASKHALTGLTRSVALEVGDLGIRVNSVHPGIIETPMVAGVGEARLARLRRTVDRQPTARMGLPEEVAAMTCFLASDDAAYCTGSQFTVDGGHLAGPWRESPA